MKLLICMITHNRQAWTAETLRTISETTVVPHRLLVVDNASTDGTPEMLRKLYDANRLDWLILNSENRYPGAACNQGWRSGLAQFPNEDFDFIMRTDNDMEFLPGWDIHAMDAFRAFPKLGQFSLMSGMQHHPPEEQHLHQKLVHKDGVTINMKAASVSGQAIFRRELYDKGLRWVEHDWTEQVQEAPRMSLAVKKMGYDFCQSVPTLNKHMSLGAYGEYEEYHEATFKRRGGVMWTRYQERLQAERDGKYEDGQRVSQ